MYSNSNLPASIFEKSKISFTIFESIFAELKILFKALSFCIHRWNLKTGDTIDSGHTIKDVIEFFRCKMYHHLQKSKDRDDTSLPSSDDEETEKIQKKL